MEQQNFILDLDDTLIKTGDLYNSVKKEFLNFMSNIGFAKRYTENIFESIEYEKIKNLGYIPERYYISMLETYNFICKVKGIKTDENCLGVIKSIGERILKEVPRPVDNLYETLCELDKLGKLFLISRGSLNLQFDKIKKTNLDMFFNYENTIIVQYKNKLVFSEFLNNKNLKRETTWSIGDSIKSDINPAIEVGIKAILVAYPSTSYQWKQEQELPLSSNYIYIDSFKNVPLVIKNYGFI